MVINTAESLLFDQKLDLVRRFQFHNFRLPFDFLTLTFRWNRKWLYVTNLPLIFQFCLFSKHVCIFSRFGKVFNANRFTITIHFFQLLLNLDFFAKWQTWFFSIRDPFGFYCFQSCQLDTFLRWKPRKNCHFLLKFFLLFFWFFFDLKVALIRGRSTAQFNSQLLRQEKNLKEFSQLRVRSCSVRLGGSG